jgi:cell division transport system permease protein
MMSLASMSSVAATLLILGIIFILIVNINSLAQGAKDQFDTIQVYLVDGQEPAQIESLSKDILELEGVNGVVYETKEDAMKKMQEQWQENGYLLEGLESNPLPDSFIITLNDIGFANYVVRNIKKMDGVEEIKYYQEIIERMMNIAAMIRTVGLGVMFALVALSTFIINNTVKLAVNARRREIHIMKYVGATNWFVRWPFLVEGTILGLLGAFAAALVVFGLYQYLHEILSSQFYVLIAAYIISVEVVMRDIIILFVVIGSGIGILGSILSMKKYLNV